MSKINYHAKLVPNRVYHIYNHSVGKENLFKQPRNYAYFWQQWNKYITPFFANYAFALMPNHYHVLAKARPISEEVLSKIAALETKTGDKFLNEDCTAHDFYMSQFASFFKSYTNSINKQETGRYGSLFKSRFRRTLLKTKGDFEYFLYYIHYNPIRHDMANDYLEYEYTSYAAYHDGVEIKGLSLEPVFRFFQTEEDSSGRTGFIEGHRRFRENF